MGDASALGLTVISMVIAIVGAALGVHYRRLLKIADEQSRQADAANRVRDQFLANISHELRTPVNAVLGWARLLGTGKLDGGQIARAVKRIERASAAQSRLIEDLLDLSRIVSGKLQIHPVATTIQPLIDAAVDSLRPAAAAKHLTLTVTLDGTVGYMALDPDRIRQIVWNLVSNAIKFTPSGGGHVDVCLSTDGRDAIIRVHDTGIGFGTRVAAHMFERSPRGTARLHGNMAISVSDWASSGISSNCTAARSPPGAPANTRARASRCGCRLSRSTRQRPRKGDAPSGGGFATAASSSTHVGRAPTPELAEARRLLSRVGRALARVKNGGEP